MPRFRKPLSTLLWALTLPALLHAAPPSSQPVSDQAISENQRRNDAMQQEQERLLAEARRQLAAMPKADPAQLARSPEARAQEEHRQRLVKMLAAIEQRIQQENARPRKRHLSPATLGATYARYYGEMRCKIEPRGAANFPQVAGRKLYGELLMALLVNHDGSLLDARVAQSSGDPELDRQAEAIARSAAPFAPFTAEMRKDADQIDITTRFRFNNVAATLEAPPHSDCPPSHAP